MNQEVKTKWLAALRSGEYEQGREQLHYQSKSRESFCCLGVLCDLAFKEGVVTRHQYDDEVRYGDVPDPYGDVPDPYGVREGEANYLPPEVQEWAGLRRNPATEAGVLSIRNDEGWSFDRIANLIEKQL